MPAGKLAAPPWSPSPPASERGFPSRESLVGQDELEAGVPEVGGGEVLDQEGAPTSQAEVLKVDNGGRQLLRLWRGALGLLNSCWKLKGL